MRRLMERRYYLTLLVTGEEEFAITQLYQSRGWHFIKNGQSDACNTDLSSQTKRKHNSDISVGINNEYKQSQISANWFSACFQNASSRTGVVGECPIVTDIHTSYHGNRYTDGYNTSMPSVHKHSLVTCSAGQITESIKGSVQPVIASQITEANKGSVEPVIASQITESNKGSVESEMVLFSYPDNIAENANVNTFVNMKNALIVKNDTDAVYTKEHVRVTSDTLGHIIDKSNKPDLITRDVEHVSNIQSGHTSYDQSLTEQKLSRGNVKVPIYETISKESLCQKSGTVMTTTVNPHHKETTECCTLSSSCKTGGSAIERNNQNNNVHEQVNYSKNKDKEAAIKNDISDGDKDRTQDMANPSCITCEETKASNDKYELIFAKCNRSAEMKSNDNCCCQLDGNSRQLSVVYDKCLNESITFLAEKIKSELENIQDLFDQNKDMEAGEIERDGNCTIQVLISKLASVLGVTNANKVISHCSSNDSNVNTNDMNINRSKEKIMKTLDDGELVINCLSEKKITNDVQRKQTEMFSVEATQSFNTDNMYEKSVDNKLQTQVMTKLCVENVDVADKVDNIIVGTAQFQNADLLPAKKSESCLHRVLEPPLYCKLKNVGKTKSVLRPRSGTRAPVQLTNRQNEFEKEKMKKSALKVNEIKTAKYDGKQSEKEVNVNKGIENDNTCTLQNTGTVDETVTSTEVGKGNICGSLSNVTYSLLDLKQGISSKVLEQAKRTGGFYCSGCHTTFRQSSAFIEHKVTKTCKKILNCEYCDKTYISRRRYDYLNHLRKHKNERNYACDVCGNRYLASTTLRDHMRKHTGEKPFKCNYCPLDFTTGSHRRNHELIQHVHLPCSFVCHQCGASFKFKSRLTCHLKIVHSDEKNFPCQVCPKRFKTKSELSQHRKMHLNIRDNICEVCGKTFVMKTHLKVHLKQHNSGRTEICEDCGKAFYQKHQLLIHRRIHTGDKPHACHLCTYRAVTKGNLVKHIKAIHENDTHGGTTGH